MHALKQTAHRILHLFTQAVAAILRQIPLLSRMLRLPGRPIRSVESWINAQTNAVSWAQRGKLPWCQRLEEPLIVARRPPASVESADLSSALHRERHHRFDRVLLTYIPEAEIVGPTGMVLTGSRRPLEESLLRGRFTSDPSSARWRLQAPEYLRGHYYTITSLWSEQYAHWLTDALPRLYAMDHCSITDAQLIVPTDLKRWQIDSLSALGIDPETCVPLNHRHLKVQFLYLPGFMGSTGNSHPLGIQWLRKRVLGCEVRSSPSQRIYVSRRSASRRRIQNEDELEPILKDFGFRIVESEKLSFKEQVTLFRSASIVVGLHGAGLANLLFAPAGCHVVEIMPAHLQSRLMYYSLSTILDQEYSFVGAAPTDTNSNTGPHADDGFADVTVCPDALFSVLARIDSQRRRDVSQHSPEPGIPHATRPDSSTTCTTSGVFLHGHKGQGSSLDGAKP